MSNDRHPTASVREVPVDWEALEDARISADPNYLRIDPVSSREQYRWMERFIPMVDDPELRGKLAHAIDGKGAFRRFKDVLMAYSSDRERWFAFRSERLRTFMEAWLNAHAIQAVPRPGWSDEPPMSVEEPSPESLAPLSQNNVGAAGAEGEPPKSQSARRRNADSLRQLLKDLADALGPRELDLLVSFAEFLKARRAARGFAHHHAEHKADRSARLVEAPASSATTLDKGPTS
jgi:hypothetical protein